MDLLYNRLFYIRNICYCISDKLIEKYLVKYKGNINDNGKRLRI